MSTKHLILGLDGADVDIIDALGEHQLPTLHRLMREGAWSRLRSVLPPATLPNWTSFLTGANPGAHGVFDFTLRNGYSVEFAAGTVREVPTIFGRLDKAGMRCACLSFPATWPPEKLENGVFVSGWDSPVAFEADQSFVWPPSVHTELRARFGPMRFDDVDEFDSDREGWHERLADRLVERVQAKVRWAGYLLESQPWDAFALYFGESDTASHHLYAHHDSDSPRHRNGLKTAERDGLAKVYRALDSAVQELFCRAGRDVELTLVSDHGSGGSGDKVLYLNRLLEEAGLLRLRRGRASSVAQQAKKHVLKALNPKLRQQLFSAAGRALPGLIESRARFGNIDFAHTRVFSDELNYFPSVHLNLRGREPAGIVTPEEADALIEEVRTLLLDLVDPFSQQKVVKAVHRREELYSGPYTARAPDLLLELHLDDGYSYNLMPSADAPPGTGPWRRLSEDEYFGRKGRSLAGSHRERGFFAMHGPRVRSVGEIDAAMCDATKTLLHRMGRMFDEAEGRVLREALTRGDGTKPELLPDATSKELASGDPAKLERRLRALGYVE